MFSVKHEPANITGVLYEMAYETFDISMGVRKSGGCGFCDMVGLVRWLGRVMGARPYDTKLSFSCRWRYRSIGGQTFEGEFGVVAYEITFVFESLAQLVCGGGGLRTDAP